MLQAKDIMTKKVVTVQPETSVIELAKLLASNNISGAPVVADDGTLLGVVTESDLIDQKKKIHIPTVVTILDSVIYLENPDKMEKEIKKIAGATVGDICSKKPVTVSTVTSIEEMATIMAEKGVHTLPVMDGDRLVGVVGKKDIIRTLIS
ncbi:CBS domain-containing protein [Desulforhopalus singaporensis]|uniref:CBS domain-containing protein n=1 Tax=Desulforhopalus singaporensis TaxID=91360 RepID=A0A1H0Q8S5_9BACT|nr:CBS domain-containing protein [Desulforhopalus singaporensis]SDP13783.1 CBS domain-containing protein [Desulforhopalus singaporensis]